MSNYTELNICDIQDPDFRSMAAELCHCVNLAMDQFENRSLSFLLMAIAKEKRRLGRQYLPTDGVLTRKVDKLPPGSVLHDLCREITTRRRTHIESFDGKTVLSLIKSCLPGYSPRLPRARKPTRREQDHQFQTGVINRRRKNGDL
ncbi:MAG TPA: hypothetical protein VLT36_10350 [Candidatus Dormibacteraeota bacterium]|nr:hypothetical protein [Candidatus Dormibacteraeota bacterium]